MLENKKEVCRGSLKRRVEGYRVDHFNLLWYRSRKVTPRYISRQEVWGTRYVDKRSPYEPRPFSYSVGPEKLPE